MTAGPTSGDALLGPLRRRIDDEMRRVLDQALEGAPTEIVEPCRYAALGPGKRIRPLIFVASRRAAGGEPVDGAVRMACSVELIHAYSLVHDDLPCMDDDVLRRGRPAHHVRFGSRVSVVAGALLMPTALQALVAGGRRMDLPDGRIREMATVLLQAAGAGGMVGGQLRDLEAEGTRPDPQVVEEIYRGKTAALIAASARMGALSCGADPKTAQRLHRFGWKLGVAFQLVDDVLDLTGTDGELGKESGRDAALSKATYPAAVGLEEAERRSRELAESALRTLDGMGSRARPLRSIGDFVVERRR